MKTIWNIVSIVSFGLFIHQIFFETGNQKTIEFTPTEIDENRPVFYIAEEMPRFPGCENKELLKSERQSCASKKMLEFVFANLKYPAIDKCSHIEGTATVQFTVEKDGSLTDIKMLRGLFPEFEKEIVKMLKTMPRWIPGKQFGKEVAIRFTLPIRIKLE